VEPVVSIAVGVLFLDESLGAARLAGAVLVLTGVTVLARLAAARDVG
jgi:drug/metabolite transporter (DMT)-like permease